MVKRFGPGEEWKFVLAKFGNVGFISSAVEHIHVETRSGEMMDLMLPGFKSVHVHDLEIHIVLDIKDWQIQPLVWKSPLALVQAGVRRHQLMLAMTPDGGPVAWLEAAAEAAFWKLGVGLLEKLVIELEISGWVKGMSLYDVLELLIVRILELNITEEADCFRLASILEKRVVPQFEQHHIFREQSIGFVVCSRPNCSQTADAEV